MTSNSQRQSTHTHTLTDIPTAKDNNLRQTNNECFGRQNIKNKKNKKKRRIKEKDSDMKWNKKQPDFSKITNVIVAQWKKKKNISTHTEIRADKRVMYYATESRESASLLRLRKWQFFCDRMVVRLLAAADSCKIAQTGLCHKIYCARLKSYTLTQNVHSGLMSAHSQTDYCYCYWFMWPTIYNSPLM